MKKYLALLFVASIVLASVVIAGCTESTTNTTNNTTSAAKASPSVSTATATPTTVTRKPQATVTPTPTPTPKPTPTPTPASQVHYGPFYASSGSNKYHYSWCRYVNNILPANLITFNTAEQAKAAGYIPCSVCKPP